MRALSRLHSRSAAGYFCLILVGYGLLLLPTMERHGISWDEQTDMDIARSYLSPSDGSAGTPRWFTGSPSDASQTRLPMVMVAIGLALTGTDSLLLGRLVSGLVGAMTIWGVYFFCARFLDRKRGLLASALLATSPFFLSFARVAFTESDVYLACAFSWLLVCAAYLRERGTVRWATATALVFGLAISAKFTAIVVLPVLVLVVFVSPCGSLHPRLSRAQFWVGTGVFGVAWVSLLGGLVLLRYTDPGTDNRILHYGLVAGSWVGGLAWAWHHRDRGTHPILISALVVGLSLLTFFVIPPVHTTNPAIIGSLARRTEHELFRSLGFIAKAVQLHLSFVVFKSSPVVGLGLVASVVTAAIQWRRHAAVQIPLMLILTYIGGLLLLPLVQTFYVVPLLPMLALLAADQWFTLYAKRRGLARLLIVAAVTTLGTDLVVSFPDYNLNGYQYLGDRPLAGRRTIGYRSVVQTTSDGVEQVAQWVDDHAQPGDLVAVHINPWHIWRATLPEPKFDVVKGEGNVLVEHADYVVLHVNHQLRHGERLDGGRGTLITQLRLRYHKVFSVKRAFDIEMASVWKLRADAAR